MRQCIHCQAELPASAQFCNRCGTPVEQEQNQSTSATNATKEQREDMPKIEQEQSQSPEESQNDAVNAEDTSPTAEHRPAESQASEDKLSAEKDTNESGQERSMIQEEKNADETLILSREGASEQPQSSTVTEEALAEADQQPIKPEEPARAGAQAANTQDEEDDDDTRPMPTPQALASGANKSSASRPAPAEQEDTDTSPTSQSTPVVQDADVSPAPQPDLAPDEHDTDTSPVQQPAPALAEQDTDASPAPLAQDTDASPVAQPEPEPAEQEDTNISPEPQPAPVAQDRDAPLASQPALEPDEHDTDASPASQPVPVAQDAEIAPVEPPAPAHTKGPGPRSVLLIAIIVLVVLAGGVGAFALLRQQTSAGATAQCAGQQANCATGTPGAARANATRLTFSGKVSGPMAASAPARCQGATTNNLRTLTVTLSGTIGNQLYNFGFAIANYHGAGTYNAAAPALTILLDTPGEATENGWGNTASTDTGNITIARGEQSGSINYLLSGFGSQAGTQVQISGNWTCG